MHKTSVYLEPGDAERLRRVAARTGRSQAELIREGVRLVTEDNGPPAQRFNSLAKGHGGGARHSRWDAEDLHRSVMGG